MELNNCTNWNEKLDVFLSHVPPTYTLLSVDNNKSVCTTIYERLIAVHKYDIEQLPKIESPIVLLKPTIQSLSFPEEDYGLHKVIVVIITRRSLIQYSNSNQQNIFQITKGKVKVCYIEGNHITMLNNDKVVAAINGEHVESVKNLKLDLTDHDNVTSIKDTYTRS